MSCPVHPKWRRAAADCPMCAELRPDRFDWMNGALDEQGQPMKVSPQRVKETIAAAMEHGKMLVAVLQTPSGDLAVRVLGPPTDEIVHVLRRAADAIAEGLKKSAS